METLRIVGMFPHVFDDEHNPNTCSHCHCTLLDGSMDLLIHEECPVRLREQLPHISRRAYAIQDKSTNSWLGSGGVYTGRETAKVYNTIRTARMGLTQAQHRDNLRMQCWPLSTPRDLVVVEFALIQVQEHPAKRPQT